MWIAALGGVRATLLAVACSVLGYSLRTCTLEMGQNWKFSSKYLFGSVWALG